MSEGKGKVVGGSVGGDADKLAIARQNMDFVPKQNTFVLLSGQANKDSSLEAPPSVCISSLTKRKNN